MKLLFTICFCVFLLSGYSQNLAEVKFHEGSSLFINGNSQGALTSVNEGLKNDPGNKKLQALKKLLEEKQKQDQQKKEQEKKKQQQQQNQENKDQDKKQKDQQKQEEKDKEKKDPKEKEQDEKEKKDQEQKDQKKQDIPEDVKKKLEEMKIDPEKAKMILEAMRNQEVQYLQQRQRESTKPKERNKPDW